MEWDKLLNEERLGCKYKMPYDESKYPISEFEKDYEKIIPSASFRRLQDKTQVFPMDKSDFIRTRLTHSMETATMAKKLGSMVIKNIRKFKKSNPHQINDMQEEHIQNILMCAGLLHDLGNPPFGHFGEVVIGEWFKKHLKDEQYCFRGKTIESYLSEQMINDLTNFEGNAQTLRILTELHPSLDRYSMNLTAALLNTLIKYPTDSTIFNDKDEDIKKHKLGYYFSEQYEFDRITTLTTTSSGSDAARHPLTYILEAADDIAYATADLEDAHKKGLFSLGEFEEFFKDQIEEYKLNGSMNTEQYSKSKLLIDELTKLKSIHSSEQTAFQEWVQYSRQWLLYSAAFGFTDNYEEIMDGKYTNDILHSTFHQYSIEIMKKKVMSKYVYSDPSILKLELSAQTIINSLLDKFVPAVFEYEENDKGYKQSKGERKLTDLISENYKGCYKLHKTDDDSYNLYLRLLLVTDFISGMTDSYAKNLYQALVGIY